MSTVTTAPAPRQAPPAPRCCRLWLQITDQRGLSRCYTVTPRPHDPAAFRVYVLTYFVDAKPIKHTVLCDEAGACQCSCPGYTSYKHCKHVAALQAAGLIERELLLQLRKLILENQQAQQQLTEEMARIHREQATYLAHVNPCGLDRPAPDTPPTHAPAVPRKPRPSRTRKAA